MHHHLRGVLTFLILTLLSCVLLAGSTQAQPNPSADAPPHKSAGSAVTNAADPHTQTSQQQEAHGQEPDQNAAHGTASTAGGHGEGGHGSTSGEAHDKPSTFDPHGGTWFNPLARAIFGLATPKMEHGHIANVSTVRYDYIVITLLCMLLLAALAISAARKVKLRPEGKPHSLANMFEAALEGYRNYLVGVMGYDLAMKYTPLIASFFFTILLFNWMGLVPGMLAPTANPNIPIALAIIAFCSVHIIAIREVGLKSYAMHFVGEPVWLAPLNIFLHAIGELVKPVALAIRLLCNVFGEEMVIAQITGLAVAAMATTILPIPFQLPIMLLGVFFGFLQALVFSTLLAIYILTMSTHHDDHDEHNAHGHTEDVRAHGHHEVIAHPTQTSVA